MKRLLIGAALVTALGAGIAPASAALGGKCDGKIDVACSYWVCNPAENPCTVSPICLVWLNGACAT